MSTSLKYLPELLEVINAPHVRTYESYNTFDQGRKLHELGVRTQPTHLFFENIVRICVRPETISDSERQHYSSLTIDDEYGFGIEVLVEDVKIFASEVRGDWTGTQVSEFTKAFKADPDNEGKLLAYEYNKYPSYSEHELESMYIRTEQESKMPKHTYGKWSIVKERSNGLLDVKAFDNRAEALAQGVIDFLLAVPAVKPEPVKIQFNASKANFNSPEYLERMKRLEERIKSLNSHKQPRRCKCGGYCLCNQNPVYGKS